MKPFIIDNNYENTNLKKDNSSLIEPQNIMVSYQTVPEREESFQPVEQESFQNQEVKKQPMEQENPKNLAVSNSTYNNSIYNNPDYSEKILESNLRIKEKAFDYCCKYNLQEQKTEHSEKIERLKEELKTQREFSRLYGIFEDSDGYLCKELKDAQGYSKIK